MFKKLLAIKRLLLSKFVIMLTIQRNGKNSVLMSGGLSPVESMILSITLAQKAQLLQDNLFDRLQDVGQARIVSRLKKLWDMSILEARKHPEQDIEFAIDIEEAVKIFDKIYGKAKI